jgi:hypothetical protein
MLVAEKWTCCFLLATQRVVLEQARVALGAILWPDDADPAPDAMYDAMRDRGVWVLY